MREGFTGFHPNERASTALVLEGNLGIRISDIVNLRPCDIVRDGDRYRLEIVEQKTGKHREFTVPLVVKQYIENYCLRNGIGSRDRIFPVTERAISKQLAIVCDYLGYEGIGTHSGTSFVGVAPKKSSSRKYACPCCGLSVRATRVVNIACLDCNEPLLLVG